MAVKIRKCDLRLRSIGVKDDKFQTSIHDDKIAMTEVQQDGDRDERSRQTIDKCYNFIGLDKSR